MTDTITAAVNERVLQRRISLTPLAGAAWIWAVGGPTSSC